MLTKNIFLLVSRSTFSNLGRSLPAIVSFGSDFQQLHQLLYIRIEILYVRTKDLLCVGLDQEEEGEAKKWYQQHTSKKNMVNFTPNAIWVTK